MRLNEFSTVGGPKGPKDYGQPNSSRYIGGAKFVVGTTHNYVLTATVDKWGLEWDEDDEIWFLDSPGAAHIADASEGEIELPPPREQRHQIHDLVTDYLNEHNSSDLQKVAAYYGHSTDGEMATEGVRVANQQIPGTKNRAKTAYYPTNVPPKVKKLDKPLTDKELSRLTNQGVKEFVQTAPVATPTGDTAPGHGFAIKVHGPFGQRQGGIAAVALWEALSAVFPDRYPPKDYQNYGAQLDSPQARVLNQIHRSGSAVVADGLASRDLAETLANKLAVFKPDSDLYVNPIGIKHVEVVDQGVKEGNLNEFDPGSNDGGEEDDRSRRLRKLLEIAINAAKENNAGSLGKIHAMNTIAGDDFFRVAVQGILPDITDREYMFVIETAYKTVKQGMAEGSLNELSPGGADRGGGNYFKTLASAWYNGTFNTGSLQKGIKGKEDVERLLQRGIVCPDGKTRKFGIDYNAEYNGVVISSDDYYEHSDHGKQPGTMIDTRTGQAWGPYDYMEFTDDELDESIDQGMAEAMTPPGEFLSKAERVKAGDKVLYKGKVVGIATGEMNGNRIIFKPNQNYGSNTTASLPIDEISLREGRHNPLDPYQRDQANSTSGMDRPEDHRDDERHDLDPVLIYALKINGKIWKQYGETVTFFTKERALSARNSILAKSPELEITLLQREKD